MGDAVYQSRLTWNPARGDTLVISCVDGRWRPHIAAFVQEHCRASAETDWLGVPGGVEPLTLADLIPKDFNFLRRRLEAVVRTHRLRRVIAVAHQDCGWYRERRIGPLALDLRARQIADLRRAAKQLHELFPAVAVETYFGQLSGTAPETVLFETV